MTPLFRYRTIKKYHSLLLVSLFSLLFCFLMTTPIKAEQVAYKAITANDTQVAIEELEFALAPLTKQEVEVEVQAWLKLLKAKATIVSEAEILVNQKQNRIEAVNEIADLSADSAELLKKKEQDKAIKEEVAKDLAELNLISKELLNSKEKKAVAKLSNDAEGLSILSDKAEDYAEKLQHRRELLIKNLTALKEHKNDVLNRFYVVLANWKSKGGDSKELTLYADSLVGQTVDLSDSSTAWLTIKAWFISEDGGLLWLANVIKFFIAIIIVLFLSNLAGRITDAALARNNKITQLLKAFIKVSVRRVILGIGFLVSISLIGINVGPVLALIGAAGLVIGLALQSTLSNFASGMLILIYRPFDIGDVIQIDGIVGEVNSMTLLSTSIKTFDNQHLIVPNNNVWGTTIINVTGSKTRRVDLVFGIGYGDDMAKAQAIMEEVLENHELVLSKPDSLIKVHELADSSVNFICRPWVKTEHYWDVYWDVTRQVKEQFDKHSVSIPFPQRDVHLHQLSKAD